jgi:hypothetical protein
MRSHKIIVELSNARRKRLVVFRLWFPICYFLLAIGLCIGSYLVNHHPNQVRDDICIGLLISAAVYFTSLKAWHHASPATGRILGFVVTAMLAAMIVSLCVALFLAVGRIAT